MRLPSISAFAAVYGITLQCCLPCISRDDSSKVLSNLPSTRVGGMRLVLAASLMHYNTYYCNIDIEGKIFAYKHLDKNNKTIAIVYFRGC